MDLIYSLRESFSEVEVIEVSFVIFAAFFSGKIVLCLFKCLAHWCKLSCNSIFRHCLLICYKNLFPHRLVRDGYVKLLKYVSCVYTCDKTITYLTFPILDIRKKSLDNQISNIYVTRTIAYPTFPRSGHLAEVCWQTNTWNFLTRIPLIPHFLALYIRL